MTEANFQPSQYDRREFLTKALLVGAGLVGAGGAGCIIADEFFGAERRPDINYGPVAPLRTAELTDTPLLGIDTSAHQIDGKLATGVFEPKSLAASGVAFYIARSGTNMTEDRAFRSSRQNARQAGILFGAYHNLYPGRPEDQADKHFDILDASGGADGMLHAVAVENNSPGPAEVLGASYDEVLRYVERFYHNADSGRLLIYTNGGYWGTAGSRGHLGNPPAPKGTELWWSNYYRPGSAPELVTPKEAKKLTGHPSETRDPWHTSKVGTWDYPAIRQVTAAGKLLQYDGSRRKVPIQSSNPLDHLRTVDLDVSFVPMVRLRQLAGFKK